MTNDTDEFTETDDLQEFDEELVDDDEELDLSDDTLSVDEADDDDDEELESSGSSEDEEDEAEALDELEAEELEMLTEDESSETIVVDEAAEMRAIRRAELSMEGEGADEATSEEFVCSSCFLVKRTSQLANKRRKICADCAG